VILSGFCVIRRRDYQFLIENLPDLNRRPIEGWYHEIESGSGPVEIEGPAGRRDRREDQELTGILHERNMQRLKRYKIRL